ncbi:MAG: RT0821/Lpp0805 family surface protein [Rhodospirillales bacterium]
MTRFRTPAFGPVAALTAILFLGACADAQDNPKTTLGTLLGAGLGGLAGSQIGSGKGQMAAIGLGVLAGAVLGNQIGSSLDKADKLMLERTTQSSLEYNKSGESSAWANPDSGNKGTVTPTRTYVSSNGTNCREYETIVNIGGRDEVAKGTACRQEDGTWRIVDGN